MRIEIKSGTLFVFGIEVIKIRELLKLIIKDYESMRELRDFVERDDVGCLVCK